jgi:hypothetical protein
VHRQAIDDLSPTTGAFTDLEMRSSLSASCSTQLTKLAESCNMTFKNNVVEMARKDSKDLNAG